MKNFILIPIILLIYTSLSGQDNQAKYYRAVDIMTYEFAYQSLKDQKDSPFLVDYENEFPNHGEDLAGVFFSELSVFLTQKDLTSTLKLCNTINNFKNRFNTDFANRDAGDYEDVNEVLRKILSQASIQSFKARHRSTYSGLSSRIEQKIMRLYGEDNGVEMEDEETNSIPPTQPETRQSVTPNPKLTPKPAPKPKDENPFDDLPVDNTPDEFDENEFTPNPPNVRNNESDFKPIQQSSPFIGKQELFWLFAMMMFGLFGLFVIRNAVPQRYDGPLIADEETMNLLKNLQKEMGSLENQNDALEEELTRLKYRIKQFEEKNIIYDPPELSKKSIEAHKNGDLPPEMTEIPLPPPVKTLISTLFYMPIPASNGTFQGSLAEDEFKRAESVYQFEITNDEGTMATFAVHEDIATMIRALDDPDRYLKPACRSNSIPHISATKIITNENGLAIKNGDNWRVQRKAMIRYV